MARAKYTEKCLDAVPDIQSPSTTDTTEVLIIIIIIIITILIIEYIGTSMSMPDRTDWYNPDRLFSIPIMAGALLAARKEEEKVSINEKIKYMWDEKACGYKSAYDPPQYVLHRCSLSSDLPVRGITAIDYAEIIAAYLFNYLPKDFYHKYGISIGDFDSQSKWN